MRQSDAPSRCVFLPGVPRAVFLPLCVLTFALNAEAAPAPTPSPVRAVPGEGPTVNEGKLERLAGQGYHANRSESCSGVDFVVKKVKIQRARIGGLSVSATLANLCTSAATAETHWGVDSSADPDHGVVQSIGTPGAGPWTWDTGALGVAGGPRDTPTTITVSIDPNRTVRERNEGNNTCRATLPANSDSKDHTCR